LGDDVPAAAKKTRSKRSNYAGATLYVCSGDTRSCWSESKNQECDDKSA
jgi:hypothetical protein